MGYYVERDIQKAINHITIAANHDENMSQYFLGILSFLGIFKNTNQNDGTYYLIRSADSGCKFSYFIVGYMYHFGINVERNIKNAIHYYKEGSSINDPYSKNNLGIIYKHGIKKEVEKNITNAKIYFSESIKKQDFVAMYNLAHLFFFEDNSEDNIDESITLLIKSSNYNFYPSKLLLCLISIMKFGIDYETIITELNKYDYISNELSKSIYNILKLEKLEDITVFENKFNLCHQTDFIYDNLYLAQPLNIMNIFIENRPNTTLIMIFMKVLELVYEHRLVRILNTNFMIFLSNKFTMNL